jgi:hypothetical protein
MTTGVEEPGRSSESDAGGWWFGDAETDAGASLAQAGAVAETAAEGNVGAAAVADAAAEADALAEVDAVAEADAVAGEPVGFVTPTPGESGRAAAARHPARLALGLAVLAAERLRAGSPGDSFLTGVGLVQQSAAEARSVARRAFEPPTRLASRAAGWARWVPGANASRRSLSRSRQRFDRMVLDARRRGAATVAAGRAEATALVQTTVADGLAWAQAQAVPQIVDGLVPHLVDEVVPRIIDGAMPEVRARVLPVVIEDLTHDPQIRDLMREQGRGMVGEAAEHLRTTSATADDRVESAFRRLVRAPRPEEPTAADLDRDGPSTADTGRG